MTQSPITGCTTKTLTIIFEDPKHYKFSSTDYHTKENRNITRSSWEHCISTKSNDMSIYFRVRYNATPDLRAFYVFRPKPTRHLACTFHISNICTVTDSLCHFTFPCIVIGFDVPVFTVERFQQTKHRKISCLCLNACFVQLSPPCFSLLEKSYSMYIRRTVSLPTAVDDILQVSRACKAPQFFFSSAKHNTSERDSSCHAKISFTASLPCFP